MKLTTKGRYAVTAMIDLTLHGRDGEPVCLRDIADRQNLSTGYLEQLFIGLRAAGLVEGVRGPCGGYRLARESTAISIAQVITAVDGPIDATQCAGQRSCQDGETCLTHDLWQSLTDHIQSFLAQKTLADVCARVENQDRTELPLLRMQAL